jgi:D-psicose/D-tagatose/L-ribulose 3-epimerase
MEAILSVPRYAFPLGIQTLLPENYEDSAFRDRLALLQQFGFTGIELNIVRPERIEPGHLQGLLAEYGLRMTMFASGATANAEGLSLSHADQSLRTASVRRCTEFIDFAAAFGAGVIVGFLKGSAGPGKDAAAGRLRDSLARLESHAREREVPLLIEATNRYESSVANSLGETADLIRGFQNPYLRILPDTYHMNIEERSMLAALVRYGDLYDSVHISDNNRYFPGLGAIDFYAVMRFLKDVGYHGSVAIEGNLRGGFEEDLCASMSYLQPVLLQLANAE